MEAFVALGRTGPQPPTWEQAHARLREHVRRDLAEAGIAWTSAVERDLGDHLEVAAQGIVDYYERRRTG